MSTVLRNNALTLEQVLSHCVYYKLDEACPYAEDGRNGRLFWDWEMGYCYSDGDAPGFAQHIAAYKAAGLEHFAAEDFRPIRFRAYLFHRLRKWSPDLDRAVEWFTQWYPKAYLSGFVSFSVC